MKLLEPELGSTEQEHGVKTRDSSSERAGRFTERLAGPGVASSVYQSADGVAWIGASQATARPCTPALLAPLTACSTPNPAPR